MKKLMLSIPLLSTAFLFGCNNSSIPQSKSDEIHESRYVQSFADPLNGCEYFTTMDGGLYPRLNKDGTQFGCR